MDKDKCTYCGQDLIYTSIGEVCSNRDCGYADGWYFPRAPKMEIECPRCHGTGKIQLELTKDSTPTPIGKPQVAKKE